MTILNLLFAIAGVALVAAVIRFGYVVAGPDLASRTATTERETDLPRAA